MSIRRFYRLCPKDSHTCTKPLCLMEGAHGVCTLNSPPSEPTGQGQCPHCGTQSFDHRPDCPRHHNYTTSPDPYPYGDMA